MYNYNLYGLAVSSCIYFNFLKPQSSGINPDIKIIESKKVIDYQSDFEYEIFPNPIFDKHLNIKFNKRLGSKLNVKTYNTLGQLVHNSTIPSVNSNFYTLKFDNLDSGVYFLSLEANQKTQTNKIIIP